MAGLSDHQLEAWKLAEQKAKLFTHAGFLRPQTLSITICGLKWCQAYSFNPFVGVRIGQAAVPGPLGLDDSDDWDFDEAVEHQTGFQSRPCA